MPDSAEVIKVPLHFTTTAQKAKLKNPFRKRAVSLRGTEAIGGRGLLGACHAFGVGQAKSNKESFSRSNPKAKLKNPFWKTLRGRLENVAA